MWIKRIVLNNFGPHEHLDVTLPRGLVGVFGFNGKGKSTMIDGAYACLTNDFSRFSGDKAECIRAGSDPDTESSVYVEAEHNGVAFTVFRCLRAPKKVKRGDPPVPAHQLTVFNGVRDDVFTKQPEIKQQLEEQLGVNYKLIGKYVFVRQWGMFDFLTETEGQLADTYQLLCGTSKAAEICKAIDKVIASDMAGLGDEVIDNSDELRTRIADGIARSEALLGELDIAGKDLPKPAEVVFARQTISKRTEFDRLTAELDELRPQLKTRNEDVNNARKARERRQKLFDAAQELMDVLKPQADVAREQLAALGRAKGQAKQRIELQEQLDRLRKTLADRKPQERHPEDPDREKHVAELNQWRADKAKAEKVLAQLGREGTVNCPVCETPVKNLGQYIRQQRTVVSDAPEKINGLEGLIELIDACREAVNQYDQWKVALERQISQCQGRLEATTVDDVEVDEPAAREAVKDFESHALVMDEARELLGEAKNHMSAAQARLDSDIVRGNQLAGKIKANKVTDADLDKSKSILERYDTANTMMATLKGRLREVKSAVQQDEAALDALTARLERGSRVRAFVNRMQVIRDQVFHRNKLPQAVAQVNLKSMEDDINEVLEGFGSPFWAESTDDLSFTVHLPGTPGFSAKKLSGGMKGVMAIAFRTALSSLFGDFGMMALDEPTAGMDSNNVSFLADALSAYAAKVRGKRQVILITHADGLRHAFDHVVEIGEKMA